MLCIARARVYQKYTRITLDAFVFHFIFLLGSRGDRRALSLARSRAPLSSVDAAWLLFVCLQLRAGVVVLLHTSWLWFWLDVHVLCVCVCCSIKRSSL